MSEVLVFSNNSKCRWVWKTTGRKVSDLRNRSKDSQPRAEMWNNLLDWRSSGAEAESVAQEWIYNYFWKGEECVRYSPGFWWAERRPEVSGLLVDVKIRWELRNCSASVVCRKLGWFWWEKKKKRCWNGHKTKDFPERRGQQSRGCSTTKLKRLRETQEWVSKDFTTFESLSKAQGCYCCSRYQCRSWVTLRNLQGQISRQVSAVMGKGKGLRLSWTSWKCAVCGHLHSVCHCDPKQQTPRSLKQIWTHLCPIQNC